MKNAKKTTNLKIITESQCKQLAASLPNPLSSAEMLDIFHNFQRLNAFDGEVDKTDHKSLRKLWTDIGLKSSQLQRYLLEVSKTNSPHGLALLKFHHDFLAARDPIWDNLDSLKNWAGVYLDFLEKLAKDRKGGRSRSAEFTYASLLKLWIDGGGKPSISMKGPCATFLMDASELILGAAPDPATVPGIVKRARKMLAATHGGKYSTV